MRRPQWVRALAVAAALGLGAAPAPSAAEPSSSYVLVQRAFLREEFDRAAALARDFLRQYPEATEANRVSLWLALSLDRLGRGSEALQVMDGVKKRLSPTHSLWPEVLFWEAEISRKADDIGRAKMMYQRLLEKYPNTTWTPQAELALGMIYMKQHAYASAITHYREVARRFPLSAAAVDAVLFEAYCYLQSRRFDDVVTLLIPYVHRQAQTRHAAQAAFYLGEALNGLKRHDEAIAAYNRAIHAPQASNWSVFGYFGLGWASYQMGRCEDSVQALAEYRRRATSPEYQVEALFAEGQCLQQLGESDRARERLSAIVRQHAGHALAFDSALLLADVEQQRGDVPAARRLLEQWRGKAPDEASQARVTLQLAGLSLQEGDTEAARRLYQQVLDSGAAARFKPAALAGLGDLEMFLGEPARARERYEEAVRAGKGKDAALTAHAQYQLGRLKLQTSKLDEAVALFRQVMASEQAAIADDARLALVVTYITQKEVGLARALLGQIRRQKPQTTVAARAAYYEALFLLEEGDEKGARRLCEETVKRAASSEEALDARLLLAEMRSRGEPRASLRAQIESWYASETLPRAQRAKLALRLGEQAARERDYVAALRWYDAASAALPALRLEAQYRSATCFEDAQDYERAMRWYERIEQPPWQVKAQLALAKLYERQGRLPEALKIYSRMSKEPVPEAKVAKERYALLRAAQRGQ